MNEELVLPSSFSRCSEYYSENYCNCTKHTRFDQHLVSAIIVWFVEQKFHIQHSTILNVNKRVAYHSNVRYCVDSSMLVYWIPTK